MRPLALPVLIVSMVAIGLLSACSETRTVAVDTLEVEGRVTVRGNEPFTEVVLLTEGGNWYLLDLTPDQRSRLVNPSIQHVVGQLYRGEWNGSPFARIRVSDISRVNQ
jgi:hypothetical protein